MSMRAKVVESPMRAATAGHEAVVICDQYGRLFISPDTAIQIYQQTNNTFLAGNGIAAGANKVVVTNGVDGTYYYYVDMENYKKAGFQFVISGGSGTVTVTLEGTMQDDGTNYDLCDYDDITQDVVGVPNITASDMFNDSDDFMSNCKYIRVKVVASTGGANDGDWTIFHARSA